MSRFELNWKYDSNQIVIRDVEEGCDVLIYYLDNDTICWMDNYSVSLQEFKTIYDLLLNKVSYSGVLQCK